ncbi:MAG: hypothetical protein KHX03_06925 [Clostridium sp.]|nr:hypothetical protein [Clostridium sp.]
MTKNIINSALITALIIGCSQFTIAASANDMPYEPVFESMPITESITTAKAEPTPAVQQSPKAIAPATKATESVNTNTNPTTVESGNLQNALMQLDSAQVEIRNQLIQYKTEYTDIDNQYKVIKEQRALKAKLIKETEKKIKNLDNTKEKIRKSM